MGEVYLWVNNGVKAKSMAFYFLDILKIYV